MWKWLRRTQVSKPMCIGWDHDGIVVCHGDDYIVTFGWDSIARVRAWRQAGQVHLAVDLIHQVGSVCLETVERLDEFERECCSRLTGWKDDWRRHVAAEDGEVTVWRS